MSAMPTDVDPDALLHWSGPPPVVLDVREPWETELAPWTGPFGCTVIPVGELATRVHELDPQRPVVCLCHHGVRSRHAGVLLLHEGFAQVFNLRGGIDRWAQHTGPGTTRY